MSNCVCYMSLHIKNTGALYIIKYSPKIASYVYALLAFSLLLLFLWLLLSPQDKQKLQN